METAFKLQDSLSEIDLVIWVRIDFLIYLAFKSRTTKLKEEGKKKHQFSAQFSDNADWDLKI